MCADRVLVVTQSTEHLVFSFLKQPVVVVMDVFEMVTLGAADEVLVGDLPRLLE
jgi:hypothetical protein